MKMQASSNLFCRLFRYSIQTQHRRIVMLGLLIATCYLPTFLGVFIFGVLAGKSDFVLNFGAIVVALQTFFQHRFLLKSMRAEEDDRFLGYALIAIGCVTLIFFRSISWSASFQALGAMMIVAGIAGSSWGLEVFQKFPVAFSLLLTSLYSDWIFISLRFFRFFTSEDMLEQTMAWLGSLGLKLLGHPAQAEASLLSIPAHGSVLVASGCSGFDMAFILGWMGFLMARLMQVSPKKTIGLVILGIGLALICNIPRIILLAFASIYWGKESFEFWHGPIGGQIFAGVLFTIYYYAAMWIIDRRSISA
jgi:exosortase/archaeosortase family protein